MTDPHADEDERTGADAMAGPNVDPLEALLTIDVVADDIQETLDVPILQKPGAKATLIPWTYRMLSDDTIEELREQSTRTKKVGRGQPPERVTDFKKFRSLIVVEATVSPDLADHRLRSKFGNQAGHNLLPRLIKPGTIDKLATAIMDLGGYDDEQLVEAGKD